MKLNYYFPTVIGQYNDEKFVDHIYPFVKNVLDNDDSRNWGYKTTFSNDSTNEILLQNKDITDYIWGVANKFVSEMNIHLPQDTIIVPFATRMMKGDQHAKHNHPHSLLSGIIYLRVPEGSSPIVFHETNDIKVYNRLWTTKNTFQNTFTVPIYPKRGDVLIWESFLNHEVPINEADNRETLVFNISYKIDK